MESKENNFTKATVERRTIGQNRACVDCGDINWSQDDSRGEVYCGSCGTVVEQNVIDGLKLEFEEEWVHLRKSNTEPITDLIKDFIILIDERSASFESAW